MPGIALFSGALVQRFKGSTRNSQQKCYYCDEAGHFARECPLKAADEEAAERLRQYKDARIKSPESAVAKIAFVGSEREANITHVNWDYAY